MKTPLIMLCTAIIVIASCSKPSPTNRNEIPPVTFTRNANESGDKSPFTPTPVDAIQLTRLDAFPEEYRQACEAISQALIEDHENPAEFYANIESAGEALIFHLWHESAFRAENAGLNGNPGGKCRDYRYDLKQQRAINIGYWQ